MKNDPVIQLLDQLLAGTSKVAAAEGPETGKTMPASEGPRSSENSKDVKNQVPGQAVDSASEAATVSGAGASTPTNSIGVKSAPTGEDVPATKTSLPDPGTSHPAKTGTEKYSSVSSLLSGANDIAARAVVYARTPKQAAAPVATPAVKEAELPAPLAAAIAKKDKKDPKKGPEAPAETPAEESTEEKMAAAVLSNTGDLTLEKKAALWDEMVGFLVGTETVDSLLKTAAEAPTIGGMTEEEFTKAAQTEAAAVFDAANTASTDLIHFILSKQAEDMPPEALAAAGVDPAAAGGAGMPPAAPGGDPTGGAGAPPADGQQIDPAMLDQLIQALAQEGITPEDLIAAAQQAEGSGGGDAGGAPAPDAGGAPEGDGEGGKGDAMDDARSAALSEEGSDDDSKGAKKEATDQLVQLLKLASKARSTKTAKVKGASRPKTEAATTVSTKVAAAKQANEANPFPAIVGNGGALPEANPAFAPTAPAAPAPSAGFWEGLSPAQKAMLIGGGALGIGGLGAGVASMVGGKKHEDSE